MGHAASSPSPATALPDDVLIEILLRLSPQPSTLLRASLVCRLWRRLVTDAHFLRRFRARHRGAAPVLGAFHNNLAVKERFIPIDGVPAARFSLRHGLDAGDDGCRWQFIGCGHGRALLHDRARRLLLVWDPVSGHCYRLTLPSYSYYLSAVLLRAAGGDDDDDHHHFRVAVAFSSAPIAARAAVYSSDTGAWEVHIATANIIGAGLPNDKPGVVAGNTVYWLLDDGCSMLALDLAAGDGGNGRKALSVILARLPRVYCWNVQLTATADGALGLAGVMDGYRMNLWALQTGGEGATSSWMLRRTVDLGELLSSVTPTGKDSRPFGRIPSSLLDSVRDDGDPACPVRIVGVGEDGGLVCLATARGGVFMLRIETMEMKEVYRLGEKDGTFDNLYPYANLFLAS